MFLADVEVNAALDARFRNGPARQLGLSTTVPALAADGTLTNVTEPTAAGYARVPVAASEWSWAADRYTEAEVVFPDPLEDWGDIVAWVLFTGGTPTVPGVPAEAMTLQAGSSDVTVICRIEDPLD